MPFIGNKPSAVPLTSADITDGIIVNADISSTAGITLNKLSGNPNFRNRIINGNMQIDQRNAGASITPTNQQFSVDRWYCGLTQASKYSVQQSNTAPTGFNNSVLFTSLSAYSVVSSDAFYFSTWVEGSNVADLGWGTANAKTVTLSFQVYSSLTGTFGGALQNGAQNRSYPFSFTVSSANTWTTVSITITGDTSGTWLTTNGRGIGVFFNLGSGSTYLGTVNTWSGSAYFGATGNASVVGTNGATFYITGVQLEAGTSATDFEFLPIDVSLARCQRYFAKITAGGSYNVFGAGNWFTTTDANYSIKYPTTMRASPSLSTGGNIGLGQGANILPATALTTIYAGVDRLLFQPSVASGGIVGQGSVLFANADTSANIQLNSEL